MKPTKSISQRVSRDSFVDPHINPEHWIGKWERGEVTSTEDSVSAARAIKRSGFHQANKRYSEYVNKHLGE